MGNSTVGNVWDLGDSAQGDPECRTRERLRGARFRPGTALRGGAWRRRPTGLPEGPARSARRPRVGARRSGDAGGGFGPSAEPWSAAHRAPRPGLAPPPPPLPPPR